MTKAAELTGQKFGRLTVLSKSEKTTGGRLHWDCSCECGGKAISTTGHLRSGHTNSCGCFRKEQCKAKLTTHGMSTTKEYRQYADMLDRCFNPNKEGYKNYGERGISVHPDFVEDFSKWYAEIGPKPDTDTKWTVGRIDNNAWYTYGNLRWETVATQSRNHTKQSNNTSGVTGVKKSVSKQNDTEYVSWVASWCDMNTKKRYTKTFGVNKYGEEKAKQLAIECRVAAIEELNSKGAGYAETHGSDK